jgi:L-asparaginase/beta-aspartyl-peptidase (threonine type)
MTAVPVVGAAVFAGPEGAVAATGDASHLIRSQLARQVYQRMLGGLSPEEAARWAAETAPEGSTVNIVVINRAGSHAASSRHSHAVTLSFSQRPGSDGVTVGPAR